MLDNRTIAGSQFGDSAQIHLGDNNYNCSHDDKKRCLLDLRMTDPKLDKARIVQAKGGLREESYCWIFENEDFKQWKDTESDSRFLWIKGNPGKGKTMLLAGIIDKLNTEPGNFGQIAYFFCQGTDGRINNATAVLRGLIYMLVKRQESLLTHVWKEYEHAGKQLFEDCNAFTALSRILHTILADSSMNETVLVIDALDECVTDLHLLLDLLVDLSQQNVRWIVSSRNWPEIDVLHDAAQKLVLRLELNDASISQAVKLFINFKVRTISTRKGLNTDTKLAIQRYMESNCNETFLWVALACQLIEDPKLPGWEILVKLRKTPAGLENIYRRMLDYTLGSHCKEDCKQILKLTLTAYRPMTLDELLSLWEPSEDTPFDKHILQEIVERAGSFLTLKDDTIYFIHQSAKDYLIVEATEELDFVIHLQHYHTFNRCLIALNRFPIEETSDICIEVAPLQIYASGLTFCPEIFLETPAELLSHARDVVLGAYSTDHTRLACLSSEGKIAIWDMEREQVSKKLDVNVHGFPKPEKLDKGALTFTSDISTLLLAYHGRIGMWNIDRESFSQPFDIGSYFVTKCHVFGREGKLLATVETGVVEIWNLGDNHMIQQYTHQNLVKVTHRIPIAFSHDGNKFVVIEVGRVVVHDLEDGEDLCIDTDAMGFKTCIAAPVFTRTGNIGVPCENGIHLLAANGAHLGTFDVKAHGGFCFSADELQIAAVVSQSFSACEIGIWDADLLPTKTDEDVEQWDYTPDCFISRNGCQLALVSPDKISIWNTQSGLLEKSFKTHGLLSVRFSEDFRWFAWKGHGDNVLRFWDTLKDEMVMEINLSASLRLHKQVFFSHPDLNLVAIWSLNGEITIWDLLSRSPRSHVSSEEIKQHYTFKVDNEAFVFFAVD
ncbi:unnamed protein product [Fusarium graminearum]|uniref:Chromosome 1, complete genome n=1 Tax=Gibberella zeae (strain ATCC MYA-4620 / CBS 123657 / FGSC 9075 / NRRL 31084 / PH-1) TaxID=229533 RepID=A0A098DAA6_GIBZE|nr:unnamed protein product [Fusarium graminearum]